MGVGGFPVALVAAFAVWQLSGAAWIEVKAGLGQLLLERAWSQVREGDENARPWPWADTSPVARLHVPGLEIRQLVLAGDDGSTLAWGPGLVSGPEVWGDAENTMISAHRDTHFRFLKDLETGQQVWLETPRGDMHKWRVDEARVVDSRYTAPDLSAPGPLLTLVTCYPFDAVEAGGPLRYVVSLSPMEEPV